MFSYLVRRLALALLLVIVVSSASLVLARLAPGDYASGSLGIQARHETVEQMRARLGLDQTIAQQYGQWLLAAARLDFGRSLLYDRPVRELIPERAANTALLAIAALIFATLVGVPAGVIAGTRRNSIVSGMIGATSLVLLSIPPLLTSLVLVFIAAKTGWLPIGGMRSETAASPALDLLEHLVLPAAALGLPLAAMLERRQSQAIHETMGQRFVVALQARGIPRSRLIWRSIFKASLRPLVSIYGLVIGTLLSGSFVVEVITAWPGLGSLMLDALLTRDVFLVAGCAGTGAIFLAFGTLLSDLALAAVDPRARDPRRGTEATALGGV